MQRLQLDVSIREGRGKGTARKLRAGGTVPAVLYGAKLETTKVSVDGHTLERIVATGANTLLDLQGPKAVKGKLVLIKDVQRDPLSQRLLHCDLFAVDTRKRIDVQVPVHLEGKAKGVELGGVLESPLREVEVSCLPLTIPDAFTVDVSGLDIGEAIRVDQIAIPEGVDVRTDPSQVVVQVVAPRVEAVEAPAEEAAEAEAPAEAAAETAEKAEGSGD
jgi:large subunit ribosomal protein L25